MAGVGISHLSLQDTNQKLDSLIEVLSPARNSFSVTPDHMAALLAEVVRAGEWLRGGLDPSTQAGMADQLEGYRLRLEKLRRLLPILHSQLLTERSRLQAEKNHLEATAAWAHSTHRQSR